MSDGFTMPTDPLAGRASGQESTLSNWVAPYVTSMLGRGEALSNMPYTPYTGPLTAGPSGLQEQAFGGIAGLTVPTDISAAGGFAGDLAERAGGMTYDPSTFTSGMFTNDVAQQYMNPYLQSALDPQIAQARRQAELAQQQLQSQYGRAGAYGGSRQAVAEAELQKAMLDRMADITGTGYRDAFDRALQGYQTDAARSLQAQGMGEQSRQFGAGFGLDALSRSLQARQLQSQLGTTALGAERDILSDMLRGGAMERDIEREGIAADREQFEYERDYPYRQVQFMQSLLQGLPVGAQNTEYIQPGGIYEALGLGGGIIELLRKTGVL
jgi:hypothetical protein